MKTWVDKVLALLKQPEKKVIIPPDVLEVDRARREMDAALAYFNAVSDPQLVDHAIFVMEAAGRKYAYLLRKAKQERVAIRALDRMFSNRTASGAS